MSSKRVKKHAADDEAGPASDEASDVVVEASADTAGSAASAKVGFTCTFKQSLKCKLLDYKLVAKVDSLDAFSKRNTKRGSVYTDAKAKTKGFVPTSVWATGAPYQWKMGNKGQGVRVAVLDTGIDRTHPALAGRVVESYDFVGDGVTNPAKWHPHGTHVSGTIAGCGFASGSGLGLLGVAPEASLLDYRVLDTEGSGSNQDIAAAIRHAADRADIISMSLGGPDPDPDLEAAVKYAVNVKKKLMVVASGNEQGDSDSPTTIPMISYPAYYSEVVSVGAVEYNDGKVARAYFSNVNREVDLCTDGYEVLSSVPGGKFDVYSGTSMATPVAAGVAALLLNKARSVVRGTPFVSEIELYSMLKAHTVDVPTTSTPLGHEDSTLLGSDWLYGAGFVTFHAAIPVKSGASYILPDMDNGAPA